MAQSLGVSTLLLTGATGSFGRAYIARALAGRWHDRIIAFSDTESNQSRMKEEFPPSARLEYFIGNVRDADRVRTAMQAGVDTVIHAAAMKEVPTCEYDWPEAVATNVDGSRNVALAAVECGVARALLISTDKAVDAVTEYGKTKAMAESWFVRVNRGFTVLPRTATRSNHHTMLSCVRYGNVLASRGSLAPVVNRKVSAGEPIPLTDLRMTRFWWTMDQAVTFVRDVLTTVGFGPGQAWIPKVKAAPVISLMQALTKYQSTLDVVGIRGKEKLHETLLAADEARHCYDAGFAYVVQPANASWPSVAPPLSTRMPDTFTYRSDDERLWMTPQEMRALLGLET